MKNNIKKVYGIGINDADYPVYKYEKLEINGKYRFKKIWNCPYYQKWKAILWRVSTEEKEGIKSYEDVGVCKEWLIFSNFKAWMEKQDWEGKELDKDILSNPSSKIYSPETCVFIPRELNLFLVNMEEKGQAYGTEFLGKSYRFSIRDPFLNRYIRVSGFKTRHEAEQSRSEYRRGILMRWVKYLENDNYNKFVIESLISKFDKAVRK